MSEPEIQIRVTFGRLLKARRGQKKWSQETLAREALGNPDRKSYVSALENGKLAQVSATTIQRLADCLDIPQSEIDALHGYSGDIAATLDALRRENGTLSDALRNREHASYDQLVALATRFEIEAPHRRSEADLRDLLNKKAEEWAANKTVIDAIDPRLQGLGNLKQAAQEAHDNLRLDEVEELLSRVHEVETEIAAETAELRAQNALLRGRVDQAYDLLSAAADSFAGVDVAQVVDRKHTYMQRLYYHGLRYGGSGMMLAERMIRGAIDTAGTFKDRRAWAMCQNALGLALQNQGTRTAGEPGAQLLGQAVDAYRAALTVRTQDAHPVHWATTQNNLGIALQTQGTRTAGEPGAQLLGQAVDAYRAALTVYTQDAHPVQWATTQNNLGIALRNQGTRTAGEPGAGLLGQAVDAYRAALIVRTQDAHPVDWAMAQENLALAEEARADHDSTADPRPHLTAALAHVEAALTVYDPEHMSYDHDTATRLRDRLRDRLT